MVLDPNQVNPSTVQIGTGQKVRNLEVTILQTDGSAAVVEMQVVAIADKLGRQIDLDGVEGTLHAILEKLEEIRFEAALRE